MAMGEANRHAESNHPFQPAPRPERNRVPPTASA